ATPARRGPGTTPGPPLRPLGSSCPRGSVALTRKATARSGGYEARALLPGSRIAGRGIASAPGSWTPPAHRPEPGRGGYCWNGERAAHFESWGDEQGAGPAAPRNPTRSRRESPPAETVRQ